MVNNGEEAVKVVENNDYDIVLMDVQMPQMDGLEATKLIRQHNGHQPVVIAMTANAMQSDEEECLKAGMDDYLSKPVRVDTLKAMIQKWAEQLRMKGTG